MEVYKRDHEILEKFKDKEADGFEIMGALFEISPAELKKQCEADPLAYFNRIYDLMQLKLKDYRYFADNLQVNEEGVKSADIVDRFVKTCKEWRYEMPDEITDMRYESPRLTESIDLYSTLAQVAQTFGESMRIVLDYILLVYEANKRRTMRLDAREKTIIEKESKFAIENANINEFKTTLISNLPTIEKEIENCQKIGNKALENAFLSIIKYAKAVQKDQEITEKANELIAQSNANKPKEEKEGKLIEPKAELETETDDEDEETEENEK